jgi:flagellar motility protein MotE (MotC chaperone)
LSANLLGIAPAVAQSWSPEVKDVARDRSATGTPKLTPSAAARAEAKAKARAGKQKAQTAPARAQPIAEPALQSPAIAPISPAAGAAAAASRPAASEAFAGQPSAEEAVAATAAAPVRGADDEELDDPFADVQVVRRRTGRDTLTTQVLPVEPQGTTAAPATASPGTAAENGAAAQYCTNIVDAAIDARIAWQRQNLTEAEKELQRRTGELETRIAEYQRWLARRDQFAEKAKKTVVDIYTKMRPDAAAAQLQSLDEETAAAVLIKLDTRAASAVMNEMEATQAARLTAIISGAGKLPPRPRAPAGQGNRS